MLPKGTDVMIPIVYLAQQHKSWGNDALAFNPGRWFENQFNPIKGSFIPFSAGARSCPGETFAKYEALTALALLIYFFSFELVPGARQIPKWTGFG